jgi:hypothetical protein
MLPLNTSHAYLLAAIAEQIPRTASPDESNGQTETWLVYIRGDRALMNYSSMIPFFKPIVAAVSVCQRDSCLRKDVDC